MKKKEYSYPVIRRAVEVRRYKNGKLIDKRIDKDNILNPQHWKGWAQVDKRLGGSTTVKHSFDYGLDARVLDSYTIRKPDQSEKIVYKRIYGQSRKTDERRLYEPIR